MRREDLLHVVHAAATITDEAEIVVIGSQSILGSHPSPPASMLRSIEADLFPLNAPRKARTSTRRSATARRFTAPSAITRTGSRRRPPSHRAAGSSDWCA
jgi:hypothetical protein